MVSKLLSTTFSANALNDAVVKQRATDSFTGEIATEAYGTTSTVSAWGFWGWLGYRAHTAATLEQQHALFQQLKYELREKYLDVRPIDFGMQASAKRLNLEISEAEKAGSFQGTDQKEETVDVVKLAAIERIEAEIDLFASQKDAILTPRMLAEFKSKVEIQFSAITMSGLKGYRPTSKGGQVSHAQTFKPLKDYKSLLKCSQTGSEVIRLTTGSDTTAEVNKEASEREQSSVRLTLAAWNSPATDENGAEKTLAHCLASLKQAYFRADAGEPLLSTKEVAFDREVSRYVESRLIDKGTGRLRDLTQTDFHMLEKLAFMGRSTKGRVERPFDDLFTNAGGGSAPSRYSGFNVEKDVGVIHLINESAGHAAMYIETFEPEKSVWMLTKVEFGYTASSDYHDTSTTQKLRDDTPVPGFITVSEGMVTRRIDGEENHYEMRNPDVISMADRNIGASVATKSFGLMQAGKMDDVTSMRMPITDVRRIIQTAKAQCKDENDGVQGNVPLYHLGGRNLSVDDVYKQLMLYKRKQDADRLELVRIQMLFDHFKELELTSRAAAAAVQYSWFGFKNSTLLQSLRDQGLLGTLSVESRNNTSQFSPTSMAKRLASVHEAYGFTSEASARLKDMERGLTRESERFEQSVNVLLSSSSLSSSERTALQQLSKTSIDQLLSRLWQDHRAIHQLSQKYENLLKIESIELDLKAARKELEMRRLTKAGVDANWNRASDRLALAMQTLRPEGWVKSLSAVALKEYCTDNTFQATIDEFSIAAIRSQQAKRRAQQVGIEDLLSRIREKVAGHPESEREKLGEVLTRQDFQPLAERLYELKSTAWGEMRLRASFLENPKIFNEYIDELISASMPEEEKNRSDAEAVRVVHDALDHLTAAQIRAFSAWQRPADTMRRDHNRDDVLTGILARNRDIIPLGAPAQNTDEEIAELETVVAVLESRYHELSADMVKGADGFTAADERGRRALRVGNCADWVRNMMRLGGVNIEGIELVTGSRIIPDRYNPPDPEVLARGRYDSFRVGRAHGGFRLHEKRPQKLREVAPQPRTALHNPTGFLTHSRSEGMQYDVIRP